MKSRGLGPHSRRHRLGFIDGRTFEARMLKAFRAELLKLIGPDPNAATVELVERAARLKLQITLMDSKLNNGAPTQQDSNVYLAWVSHFSRLLGRLGLVGPEIADTKAQPGSGGPTFDEIVADIARQKAQEAA
jgi:hypothetical protein